MIYEKVRSYGASLCQVCKTGPRGRGAAAAHATIGINYWHRSEQEMFMAAAKAAKDGSATSEYVKRSCAGIATENAGRDGKICFAGPCFNQSLSPFEPPGRAHIKTPIFPRDPPFFAVFLSNKLFAEQHPHRSSVCHNSL